jgi:DNA-directed RNA polymerase specialized sigma24 family protein
MGAANEDGAGYFPTTRWSEVARAGSPNADQACAALDILITRYQSSLKQHLRFRFGVDESQAQDWLQAFLLQRVLVGQLMGKVSRDRGKFRTFLLNALNHFVIDQLRHDAAQRRRPSGGWASLDDLPDSDAEPATDSFRAFTIEWARDTVEEVERRMEAECKANGDQKRWELFYTQVLEPTRDNTPPPPYAETVARLGYRSNDEAYNVLVTAKRQFRRVFYQLVAEYVGPGENIETEVRALLRILRQQ